MLSPPARLPPAPVLNSPNSTGLDGAGANALAGGQLLGVVIFLGLWVPHLIRVPQAPAIHEDLTVTAGSLGHQTLAQGGGSRCLQVAITRCPAETGTAELEHAVDVAVEALALLGLGDLNGQMSQLALNVQHRSQIRVSTHADSSIAWC